MQQTSDIVMSGETELKKLIATMTPILSNENYVFCSIKSQHWDKVNVIKPLGFFKEAEGYTLIVETATALQWDLKYAAEFKKITLEVHSSLHAVGLTAAVSTQLTSFGISANIVAGFYHDHIFVPLGTEKTAIDCLRQLAVQNQ
jgi:uncharacterized protein